MAKTYMNAFMVKNKTVLWPLLIQFFLLLSLISGDAWRAVYTNRDSRGPEQRLSQGLLWRKCQYFRQRGALCVFHLSIFSFSKSFSNIAFSCYATSFKCNMKLMD